MNRMTYVLSERERRMTEMSNRRRIESVKTRLFNTAISGAKDGLSFDENQYLRYLCGQNPDEGNLSPHTKAYIGNLFKDAFTAHRKDARKLPANAMPGMDAVHANRKIVTDLHKKNSKFKRAKKPKAADHRVEGIKNNPNGSAGWRIIREQDLFD